MFRGEKVNQVREAARGLGVVEARWGSSPSLPAAEKAIARARAEVETAISETTGLSRLGARLNSLVGRIEGRGGSHLDSG